tara:strand:- start:337 stop:912 length:576 start_codon:yes stop_codon:yes gene_type:complete
MGVLLISQSKLKAFTTINKNLDVELLLPNIQIAQDYLQVVIGTKLLFHLEDAVQNNTLTTDEVTLLEDYIQPVLLHQSYYEAIPSMWVRIMNKSMVEGNTEQGTSIDAGSMKYLRNIQENRYQFYQQRLLDYLNAYSNLFPQYTTYSSSEGGVPPSQVNYFSGIVVPSGNRGRNYPLGGSNNGDYDSCFDC